MEFDLDKLPKISFKSDAFMMIVFGLLPVVLGILVLLGFMVCTELT